MACLKYLLAVFCLAYIATTVDALVCKTVTLRSNFNTPAGAVIRDNNGTPVTILHVFVSNQLSAVPCVEWKTFFYRESLLQAKKGCAATFRVCYEESNPTTPQPISTIAPGCQKVRLLSRQARPVNKTLDSEVIEMTLLQDLHDKVLCQQGVNFFFQGNTVFANGGCRGDFHVCTTGVDQLTTPQPGAIRCKTLKLKSLPGAEARQQLRSSNGTPMDIESVTVMNQISNVPCREWVTFFIRRSFLTVKNGCYARFRVCYRVPVIVTEAPLTTPVPVKCKRIQVLKPIRRIVRNDNGEVVPIQSFDLVREISRPGICRRGFNYRFSGSLYTVLNGCKGIFKICYGVVQTTPASVTTPSPLPVCRKVTAGSNRNQPQRVDITDANGNPAKIVHVHVWDQISARKCVEWNNYFIYDTYIITKNGCKATFKVCYISTTPTTVAPVTTPLTPNPGCDLVKLKSRKKRPAFVSYALSTIVSMTLIKDLGAQDCIRGRSFGFQNGRAFARDGCRGLFEICLEDLNAITTPAPDTPVCKKIDVLSTVNQQRRVDITDTNGNPVKIVHVNVWDQISAIKCVEWVNYFVYDSYIVAKKGCRATFKVCYVSVKPTTFAPITTPDPVVCNNLQQILRPTRKTITNSNGEPATVTSFVLVREISNKVCKAGVNYFSIDSIIVVKNGCKGVFRVCYTNTLDQLTTPDPTPVCKKVDVLSTVNKQRRVDITDTNGNPVKIVHVNVWDQISAIKCVEWVNYFVYDSYIVAKNGCRATFKVCYVSVKPTTFAPITTPEPEVCNNFQILRPTRKTITDSNGEPASITRFVLVREISNKVCKRGVNWFRNGATIVIKNGCKGVFRVCYKNSTPDQLTTPDPTSVCKKIDVLSTVNKQRRVDITDTNGNPVKIIHVNVWDQISAIKCVEWVNYFVYDSYIVAKNGCRATFKVCYVSVKPTTFAPITTPEPVVCNNHQILRPTRKTITDSNGDPATITRFVLRREISNKVCKRNINWFRKGSTIVIKNGCKGVFRVCYKNSTPNQLTTPAGPVCKKVQVLSTMLRPARVDVTDANGNPVQILSAKVRVQISSIKCIEWKNYFVHDSFIIAKKGCRAVFNVCYIRKVATTPSSVTTPPPVTSQCKKITVKSTLKQNGRKDLTDANGKPVKIFHVHVWDQISVIKCVEWQNYIVRESSIITKNGCHATFKVCYKGAVDDVTTPSGLNTTPDPRKCRKFTMTSNGGDVTRSVKDNRLQPGIIREVIIVRIFGGTCTLGTSVNFKDDTITVGNSCSGVFKVCYDPAPLPTTAALTTASTQKCRRYTLAKPTTRQFKDDEGNPVEVVSLTLVKVVGNGRCVLNTNYFFSGSTVTVKGVCKGVFNICTRLSGLNPITTPATQKSGCKTVGLNGSGPLPDTKTITSSTNRPIVIKSITIVVEFSKGKCHEWVTFFASGNTVLAKDGCRGRFNVCYDTL